MPPDDLNTLLLLAATDGYPAAARSLLARPIPEAVRLAVAFYREHETCLGNGDRAIGQLVDAMEVENEELAECLAY